MTKDSSFQQKLRTAADVVRVLTAVSIVGGWIATRRAKK